MEPKFPDIEVFLDLENENCYHIYGNVLMALVNAQVHAIQRSRFYGQARYITDKQELIAFCRQWVVLRDISELSAKRSS